MNKSCLNCAYEPDWEDWLKIDGYAKRSGKCRWIEFHTLQILPKTFIRHEKHIVMYDDNSGIYHNCPCWKEKT